MGTLIPNNLPEDTTHYCPPFGQYLKAAYKQSADGDSWFKWTGFEWRPMRSWPVQAVMQKLITLQPFRPKTGDICELRTRPEGGWGKAEIKYVSATICVWRWVREDGGVQAVEYAENPEKIQFRRVPAAPTEAEVKAIMDAAKGPFTQRGISWDSAVQIYLHGYRKVTGDD